MFLDTFSNRSSDATKNYPFFYFWVQKSRLQGLKVSNNCLSVVNKVYYVSPHTVIKLLNGFRATVLLLNVVARNVGNAHRVLQECKKKQSWCHLTVSFSKHFFHLQNDEWDRLFLTGKSPEKRAKYSSRMYSFCSITVFENHRKSLIQHCERSELRLHF